MTKTSPHTIKFQVSNYNQNLVKNGYLSVYLSPRELIISIYTAKKQLVAIETANNSKKLQPADFFYEYVSGINSPINNKELHSLVKEKYLSVATSRWTLVPAEFYQEGQALEHLSLETEVDIKKDVLFEYKVDYLDAYFIFAVPSLLVKRADFFIKGVEFYHPMLFLMQNFKVFYDTILKKHPFFLQLHFNLNKMGVLFFHGEKLLIANVYDVDAVEDAIYFIYEIHHKLEIAQRDTLVLVSGVSAIKDKLQSMIPKFYKHILHPAKIFTEYANKELVEIGLYPVDLAHLINYTK